MANEITLFESKIRNVEHNLFPIQAKHREELRTKFTQEKVAKQIKINEIRDNKVKEIKEKYKKEIEKGAIQYKKEIDTLNKEFIGLLKKAFDFKRKTRPEYVELNYDSYLDYVERDFVKKEYPCFKQSINYGESLLREKNREVK